MSRLCFVAFLVLSLTVATSGVAEAAACDATWRVQSASGLPTAATVRDVAVTGTGETWAVGETGGQGLLAHFVNGSWTSSRYAVAGHFVSLHSVDARPGVAWAVGTVRDSLDNHSWLVLVNTGSGWRRLDLPPDATGVIINSVVIRQPDDVWFAGARSHWPNADDPAALHWNGSRLTAMTLPFPGFALGIEAPPGGGVVLTGASGILPQAWRWNGSAWRADRMPPRPPEEEPVLRNVDGTSQNMWAVGDSIGGCCSSFPFVYRWAGSRWVENTPSTFGSFLQDILVSRADGHVIVVGQSPCADDCSWHPQGEIWEWSNTGWKQDRIAGLTPDEDSNLVAIDGDGHGGRWAVGSENGHPLLLRQCVASG